MKVQKNVDHTLWNTILLSKNNRPNTPVPFPPPNIYKYGKEDENGNYCWQRQPIKLEKMKDLWSMRNYSTAALTPEELNHWYPYPSQNIEEQEVMIEDEDLELDKLYEYLYKRVVSNEIEESLLKDAMTELIPE
jgi:hypothetical protein